MFDGIYPEGGNFSWHHLWFILYLFIISLIISPFLKLFRSPGFQRFSKGVAYFAEKPLSLNVVLILLLVSQILLRPHFPDFTGAVINDLASMTFYIIFFLSGFILLSNKHIIESIRKQRYLYLAETILFTAMMFSARHIPVSRAIAEKVWDVSSIFIAWSCGLAAIGFARQYLNRDGKLRKLANEAIYPFYLLHQPVILIIGFLLIRTQIPDLIRLLILLPASFVLTCLIYWYLVRPFNLTRVIFGLKPQVRRKDQSIQSEKAVLIPVPTSHI